MLEDVTVTTASALVSWLYTKTFSPQSPDITLASQDYYWELAQLGVCANKYMIAGLHEHLALCMAKRIMKDSTVPQIRTASLICENLPSSCTLRQALTSYYAAHVQLTWFFDRTTSHTLTEHPNLASDLVGDFAKQRAYPKAPCDMHKVLGWKECVKTPAVIE